MISRLVLENWKTHKRSEFLFGKGTNVLVGVMGSGKTAVTEAISFCLFGTFPALLSKRVVLDEVIMAKPELAESARLAMEFDYAKKKYSVERVVYRGKKVNEAKLYCDGRLVAGPKVNDVNEKICEALEISYDLFSRAVYSEQNQIDFFLRLSPGERKQKFDELLEIEKYERARENAGNVSRRLKAIVEDKKRFLKEQTQALKETNIAELQKRLEEKGKKKKELEKKIMENEKEERELAEKIKKCEAKETEFNFFKNLVSNGRGKTEAMEKERARKKKDLDSWKEKSIETELKELEKKEKELLVQREQNEKQLKEARSEQMKISQSNGAIENELKKIEKSLSEIEKAKAHCPVCRKPLEEKTKKEIIWECENEKKRALAQKEKNEKQERELKEKIESAEKAGRKTVLEIEALWEKNALLKGLLKSAEEMEKLEKEISSLKHETEKAEKSMKELCFEEHTLQQLREQKAEASAGIRALKSEIRASEEMEKELAERIELYKKTEQQLEEIRLEIEKKETLNEKLALFTNCIKMTQAELREKLIEAVNAAMSDIWERIYPYKDFSSAKILVDEKGDYELVVKERSGKWVRVEGILSGGERSAAAICIRIAFSLVLAQNLSWLILDEPTHNLDAQAVSVLSEMMKTHLPELVEQIFVITHDKQMEKAASASLYLLERDKDNDGTTNPILKETQ